MTRRGRSQARAVWAAAALLAILHQDFWLWDDGRLVLGFLPAGLFSHALFTLAATTLWAVAVRWAWPARIEAWADEPGPAASPGPEQGP